MKNIDAMSFCGDVNFRQQIIDLLYSHLLDVPKGSTTLAGNQIMEKRYDQMRSCLNLSSLSWTNINLNNTIVPRTKDVLLRVDANQFNPSYLFPSLLSMPNWGMDLPVWTDKPFLFLKCNGALDSNDDSFDWCKKRIMIVAQDPLRRGLSGGALYLSSPFGLHSKDYRGNRLMTQIVNDLLLSKKSPTVYLTDFNKFFVMNSSQSISLLGNLGAIHIFEDVLRAEIRLFNPDLVVAVGKSANQAICRLGISYKILTLPHVNARLTKAQINAFGYTSKKNYYVGEILRNI